MMYTHSGLQAFYSQVAKIRRIGISIGLGCIMVVSAGFALPGMSIFHIGNSLTDETYGVNNAAVSLGHTNVRWGRCSLPGAPIWMMWTNRAEGGFRRPIALVTEGNPPELTGGLDTYFKNTAIDAVVLQIFNSNGDSWLNQWVQPGEGPLNYPTVEGILGFAKSAYQGNPNCQIYLYASHTMDEKTVDQSMTSKIIDYKALMDTISRAYPNNKPARIIPAPLAFNKMLNDGFGDLWVPGDGHANANGKYLLCMLFYSVIYKRSCVGATNAATGSLPAVSASFAAKAQAVAWNIAQTYQYSGVTPVGVKNHVNVNPGRAATAHAARLSTLQGKRISSVAKLPTARGWYIKGTDIAPATIVR